MQFRIVLDGNRFCTNRNEIENSSKKSTKINEKNVWKNNIEFFFPVLSDNETSEFVFMYLKNEADT